MNVSEVMGISFVMGILGIGVSFVMFYFKSNSNLCERVSKLETKVESVYEMLKSLRDDRDKFHPRT